MIAPKCGLWPRCWTRRGPLKQITFKQSEPAVAFPVILVETAMGSINGYGVQRDVVNHGGEALLVDTVYFSSQLGF